MPDHLSLPDADGQHFLSVTFCDTAGNVIPVKGFAAIGRRIIRIRIGAASAASIATRAAARTAAPRSRSSDLQRRILKDRFFLIPIQCDHLVPD